jgi:hypothetical protein
MINKAWVEKVLGKKRMKFVEDIDVSGGVIDIMLFEQYEITDGATIWVLDYECDDYTKADIAEMIRSEVNPEPKNSQEAA